MRGFSKIISLILCFLSGCANPIAPPWDTADTFALNDAAKQIGHPNVVFARTGIGRGPVIITLPNGEILRGTYRVAFHSSIGMAFLGGQMATAYGMEDGGNVQFVARGPRTEILCQGRSDTGHGSGKCVTDTGALWAVSW